MLPAVRGPGRAGSASSSGDMFLRGQWDGEGRSTRLSSRPVRQLGTLTQAYGGKATPYLGLLGSHRSSRE